MLPDIDKSIAYFLHECTDEEFYWLSEAFEELSGKAQSKDLIAAWRSRLAKVTPETYCRQNFKTEHMQKWVDYAEYVRCTDSDIAYVEDRIE